MDPLISGSTKFTFRKSINDRNGGSHCIKKKKIAHFYSFYNVLEVL